MGCWQMVQPRTYHRKQKSKKTIAARKCKIYNYKSPWRVAGGSSPVFQYNRLAMNLDIFNSNTLTTNHNIYNNSSQYTSTNQFLVDKNQHININNTINRKHMCQGLNSHYFHITWDGHQPNSKGQYTNYMDSYDSRWDDHQPHSRELIDPGTYYLWPFRNRKPTSNRIQRHVVGARYWRWAKKSCTSATTKPHTQQPRILRATRPYK